jgi:hypothetical protein
MADQIVNVSTPVRAGGLLTEAYVREVARLAFFWAWPMVNLHNRLATFEELPAPGLIGGVVPVSPPNEVAMLRDYITPDQKMVACPNQDVVYGFGPLAPGRQPVIIQVPDFGERFWVYQVCDQRTDGFADLGAMYDTRPGLYMVTGPDWDGEIPASIAGVYTCPTAVGICIPRVFLNDTDADRVAVRELINQIAVYPLSEYDGDTKTIDWSQAPVYPAQGSGEAETAWVFPKRFADQLAAILAEVPPLPGEDALYDLFHSVTEAIERDGDLRQAFTEAVVAADEELVSPLFQFHRYGHSLPGNWTTIDNNGQFGTDYYNRTAAAKSNIFVNKPTETKYFYGDLDGAGQRLNGSRRYTVTFPAGQLPPVQGFWSLTLYNEHHFFHPNELNRYSLGTKNETLAFGADGSLTLYAQADPPAAENAANWLPAPAGDFSLYLRAYWPETAITDGTWTPPPIVATET